MPEELTYPQPKTESIEDSSFIERLTHHEEEAFKQLVHDYKDRVYNTCLGFLRNPQDAEDTAQEVFIKIYDSIGDFREESSLSTWIYKIAVTQSLELIRYRKRKKRRGFFEALADWSAGNYNYEDNEDSSGYLHPGIQMENKERAEILFKEIDKLTEKQKVAFTLHKIEGLAYKEVAEIMDQSLPSVESLIHRAKESLKKQLYDYYYQNEID